MADVIDVVDENEKNVEISYEEYAAFPTMVYKFKSKLPVVDHIQMAQWIKRHLSDTQYFNLSQISIWNWWRF